MEVILIGKTGQLGRDIIRNKDRKSADVVTFRNTFIIIKMEKMNLTYDYFHGIYMFNI